MGEKQAREKIDHLHGTSTEHHPDKNLERTEKERHGTGWARKTTGTDDSECEL